VDPQADFGTYQTRHQPVTRCSRTGHGCNLPGYTEAETRLIEGVSHPPDTLRPKREVSERRLSAGSRSEVFEGGCRVDSTEQPMPISEFRRREAEVLFETELLLHRWGLSRFGYEMRRSKPFVIRTGQ
jgi:hypothetical protein